MIAAAIVTYGLAFVAGFLSICGFIVALFHSEGKDGAWVGAGLFFSFSCGGISAGLCIAASHLWGLA